MKRLFLSLCIVLFLAGQADAWRKWEFVNPADLDIRLTGETAEIFAGETATFTISIRNKTDKPVRVTFPTGQRWDLAVYHDGKQISRWSQGLWWEESLHSLDIRPGFPETFQLSWKSRDRNTSPLPQGVYRVQGMVMTQPRVLMTNMVDVRLLPKRVVHEGTIKVKLNQHFRIDLPRYEKQAEIDWHPEYVFNDNRIKPASIRREGDVAIWYFLATRRGHVVVHFYGYDQFKTRLESVERKTYRIEVEVD